MLGFYAFAGLGTVAKGPVSLLPPLLGIVAFLLWQRDREGFRKLWLGRGLLVYAGVVLLWLVPAAIHGGTDYLHALAFRQTVERYAEPWHHFQPWYYYLEVMPADFFPWSLLLPGALVAGWKGLEGEHRRGFRFALAWCAATLVFFTLSPGKRTIYTLTMYPALALAVGAGLDHIAAVWPRHRRWIVWPLAALAVLLAATAAALPRIAARRAADLAALGDGLVAQLAALLILMTLAASAAALYARRGEIASAVAALALGLGMVTIAAVLWVLPRFEAVKSARPLAEELIRRIAPGEPYAMYPRLEAGILFYTHRFCELPANESELRAFASRPGRVWLLLRKDQVAELQPPLGLVEIARDADDRRGWVLLTKP